MHWAGRHRLSFRNVFQIHYNRIFALTELVFKYKVYIYEYTFFFSFWVSVILNNCASISCLHASHWVVSANLSMLLTRFPLFPVHSYQLFMQLSPTMSPSFASYVRLQGCCCCCCLMVRKCRKTPLQFPTNRCFP